MSNSARRMHKHIAVRRLILLILNQSLYGVEGLPPASSPLYYLLRELQMCRCTSGTLNRMGESSSICICEPLGLGTLEGRIDGAVARPWLCRTGLH
jgi:hypothetical protein